MGTKPTLTRRIVRIFCWTVGALVAIYLIEFFLFATGQPFARINYTQVLNKDVEQMSADDCAWPLYRQALIGFDFNSDPPNTGDDLLTDATPSGPRWGELVSWLTQHENDLALLRQASAKPALGFIFGPGGDSDDGQLFPGSGSRIRSPDENQPLISVLLSHLSPLRSAANALRADARLARQQNDIPRVLADAAATLHLGEQLRGGFLVGDLVSVGILAMGLEQIDDALTDANLKLSDADLRFLSDLIAKPAQADGLLSYRGERMFFDDLIQRTYTDDGNGDGRLTLQGIRFMQDCLSPGGNAGDKIMLYGVASPILSGSRRAVTAEYNRLMDAAEANLKLPYRQVRWSDYSDAAIGLRQSPMKAIRFFPITFLLPSLERSHQTAERYLGTRDGIRMGIALELYRHEHGAYPESLDVLVPALLTELPVDRISGEAMRYRLVDGKPVVYSVGADRDDDGGRPATNKSGEAENHLAVQWDPINGKTPDGDWILFPRPSVSRP